MKRNNKILQFTDLSFNHKQKSNFSFKENKETDSTFMKPTDEEVQFFKERARSYDPDNVVPVIHWDGECWKGFLEKAICEFLADGDMTKAWDYLAIFIYKQFEDIYRQGFDDGYNY